MPREFVHWMVLHRALEQMEGPLAESLRKSGELHAAAFLGAVLHDAPYYHRLGRGDLWKVGNFLHGHAGCDTLEPIRKILLNREEASHDLLSALAVGMLSHAAADIVFHPFVFYWTGNYYASDKDERTSARRRHRLFEVYLDSWGRTLGPAKIDRRITHLYDAIPRFDSVIAPVLARIGPSGNVHIHDAVRWSESVRDMGWLQRIFLARSLGAVMRLSNKAMGGRFGEWDALYSFGRRSVSDFFRRKQRYRNPVSGEWLEHDCAQLLEMAILKTVYYLGALQSGSLDELRGESLNYGIFSVGPEEGKYFDPRESW